MEFGSYLCIEQVADTEQQRPEPLIKREGNSEHHGATKLNYYHLHITVTREHYARPAVKVLISSTEVRQLVEPLG